MINMLRIDERLIHGQTAVVWSKVLKISHIMVANDDVANNETQQVTMKMAVPDNLKFICRGVDESISILKDPRAAKFDLFVVVQNFSDALKIAQAVKNQIKLINVGNYGLLPINQHGNKQEKIATAVEVDKRDLEEIRQLADLGITFEAQLTPDSQTKNFRKIYGGV